MSFNGNESDIICDVWSDNLLDEFKRISRLVNSRYNFVALDTEFPGIIGRPIGQFVDQKHFLYQSVRCNVNLSKVIQIGLTLMDSTGRKPDSTGGVTTWQFNFRFDLSEDMFAGDAIDLLMDSGVQFKRLAIDGIDSSLFAEQLMASGLVLNPEVTWIAFHGGYDFAHLLKLLTDEELPSDAIEFNDLLKQYFPIVYDLKYLNNRLNGFTGSLQDMAKQLNLKRIGRPHQAGSDSYVAGNAFFQLYKTHFADVSDILNSNRYQGHLYGLDIFGRLDLWIDANHSNK